MSNCCNNEELVFTTLNIPIMRSAEPADWFLTEDQDELLCFILVTLVKPDHQQQVKTLVVPMCRDHFVNSRQQARKTAFTTLHDGQLCFYTCARTRDEWFDDLLDTLVPFTTVTSKEEFPTRYEEWLVREIEQEEAKKASAKAKRQRRRLTQRRLQKNPVAA